MTKEKDKEKILITIEELDLVDIGNMKLEEAKNIVDKLRLTLNYYNDSYYNKDNPEISDYQYDRLMKYLVGLENKFSDLKSPDSPSMRVGGNALEKFEQYTHERPMLSLSNVFSPEEIRDFDRRVRSLVAGQVNYVVEFKIDGLSVGLTYEDGLLSVGATRGDGYVGENVTENLRSEEHTSEL